MLENALQVEPHDFPPRTVQTCLKPAEPAFRALQE